MGEFEFVPHTADIAVRVQGNDFGDLLRTAGLGLAAAAVGEDSLEAHRAPGAAPRALHSDGAPDEEGLLVNFLNEVIFQAEVNGEVYTDFEVTGSDPERGVDALAFPDPSLGASHAVKAATYYDLRVTHRPDGVEATVVFDV